MGVLKYFPHFLLSCALVFGSGALALGNDGLPLKKGKSKYVLNLSGNKGKGKIERLGKDSGLVNMEISADGEDYVLKLDALFKPFPFSKVKHVSNFKIRRGENGVYRSLENRLTNSFKFGILPSLSSEYSQVFNYGEGGVELVMKNGKKENKYCVSSDAQGPFALLMNYLSREDNVSSFFCGRMMGNNAKEEESVYCYGEDGGGISDYLLNTVIPAGVFLAKATPLRVYYNKEGKDVDIIRLQIFAESYLNGWVVARSEDNN